MLPDLAPGGRIMAAIHCLVPCQCSGEQAVESERQREPSAITLSNRQTPDVRSCVVSCLCAHRTHLSEPCSQLSMCVQCQLLEKPARFAGQVPTQARTVAQPAPASRYARAWHLPGGPWQARSGPGLCGLAHLERASALLHRAQHPEAGASVPLHRPAARRRCGAAKLLSRVQVCSTPLLASPAPLTMLQICI